MYLLLSEYDSEAFKIFRESVVVIAAVHNFALWTFHGTYSFGTNERNKIHSLSVWALTLITLACVVYVIVPYITVYNDDVWNVPLTAPLCKWIIALSKFSVVYPKTIGLHYVYIERLFVIFKDNVYSFKRWQKWSLRGFLVVTTLMWTVVVLLNADDGYKYNAEKNVCMRFAIKASSIAFAACDLGVCSLITALYCRRLLIFVSRRNTTFLQQATGPNAPQDIANSRYFKVMVKSTVLTFVASSSTQIALTAGWLLGVPELWFSLDAAFNSWCLILIFDLYDELFNLYPCCCCLCEKLMCYHCIVCCSCHYCCGVDIGGSSNLRPEIRNVNQQTAAHRQGEGGNRGNGGNRTILSVITPDLINPAMTTTMTTPNRTISNVPTGTTVELQLAEIVNRPPSGGHVGVTANDPSVAI